MLTNFSIIGCGRDLSANKLRIYIVYKIKAKYNSKYAGFHW
jgi:hypothetical protein